MKQIFIIDHKSPRLSAKDVKEALIYALFVDEDVKVWRFNLREAQKVNAEKPLLTKKGRGGKW